MAYCIFTTSDTLYESVWLSIGDPIFWVKRKTLDCLIIAGWKKGNNRNLGRSHVVCDDIMSLAATPYFIPLLDNTLLRFAASAAEMSLTVHLVRVMPSSNENVTVDSPAPGLRPGSSGTGENNRLQNIIQGSLTMKTFSSQLTQTYCKYREHESIASAIP